MRSTQERYDYDRVPHKRPEDAVNPELTFTSNEPRIFANFVITKLATSKILVRSRDRATTKQEMEKGRIAEQFFLGMLNEADRRLIRRVEPRLHGQQSFYAPMRGFVCGVHVIGREEDGTGKPFIEPWDPLNTYWSVGEDGLDWICHVLLREYNDLPESVRINLSGKTPFHEVNGQRVYEVYNYYDKETHSQVVDGTFLKPKTKHGATHVPGHVVQVGYRPLIPSIGVDSIARFGQRLYETSDAIYELLNEHLSLKMEMAKRQAGEPVQYNGDDQLAEDAALWSPNSVVYTSPQGKISPIFNSQTGKDEDQLLSHIVGILQRATLSHVALGDVAGLNLSGYAINQLSKELEGVIKPYEQAISDAYSITEESLREQAIAKDTSDNFIFMPFPVEGIRYNRTGFAQEISPEQLAELHPPTIELLPDIPVDDTQTLSRAEILLRSGLGSKGYVRREVIKMEDPDTVEFEIEAEQAEEATPLTKLQALIEALIAQDGSQEQIEVLMAEAEFMMAEQGLRLAQMRAQVAQGGGGGPGGQRPPGGGGGKPPNQQTQPQQGERPGTVGGDPRAGLAPAGQGAQPPTPDARNTQGGRPPGPQGGP